MIATLFGLGLLLIGLALLIGFIYVGATVLVWLIPIGLIALGIGMLVALIRGIIL